MPERANKSSSIALKQWIRVHQPSQWDSIAQRTYWLWEKPCPNNLWIDDHPNLQWFLRMGCAASLPATPAAPMDRLPGGVGSDGWRLSQLSPWMFFPADPWWAWKQCYRIRSWSQKTAEFRWPKLPSFRENQLWSWWNRSEWAAFNTWCFPQLGVQRLMAQKWGANWPKGLAVHSGKTFVFWRLNILNQNHTYHFNRTPWERPQDIQWMLARSPWFIH